MCKSLDDLIDKSKAKQSINCLETIVKELNSNDSANINDIEDDIIQEDIDLELDLPKLKLQSKGIELKDDAPAEEKVELTEDLMPYEDFKKELIKKLRLRSESSVWVIEDKLSHVKLQKISKDFLKVYFNVIKDNSKDIKKFITTQFEKYNYEITLHGRKQPLNVFISNIINSFIDILEPTKE